jgi:rSAM/selenodomain-associated transferase 2
MGKLMASTSSVQAGKIRGGLSVIIPALDEEDHIGLALDSVRDLGAEVIVVDGGSRDRTRDVAARRGARVMTAPRGRGTQLIAGAEAATGRTLFFMHADSILSGRGRSALVDAVSGPSFQIGTFRLGFDRPHPLSTLYSWCTCFDSVWTSFGDQGIVIRRELYERLGGFPPWEILEDVELLRRARRLVAVRSLAGEMITSARRFERVGILRQQLRNAFIILRYLAGTCPGELVCLYEAEPSGPAPAGSALSVPSQM